MAQRYNKVIPALRVPDALYSAICEEANRLGLPINETARIYLALAVRSGSIIVADMSKHNIDLTLDNLQGPA